MKKRAAVWGFFFLFFCTSLFADKPEQPELTGEFQEIITLTRAEQDFLGADFNRLSYERLFYYFVLVSEQEQFYDQYYPWFTDLEKRVDAGLTRRLGTFDPGAMGSEEKKALAEALLEVLHEELFNRYFRTAYSAYWLLKSNTYNCVSSAIIYTIFCKKYGIPLIPVETDDHVFVKAGPEGSLYDVETTSKYGFNPGEKKEVLDRFGELTGFSYVSPQNYKKRRDIDLKKLFLIVYYNSAALNQQHKKYFKAVHLAYIVKLGRKDEEGESNFRNHFKNYVIYLMNQKKCEPAVGLINSYLSYFGFSRDFMDLRFDILYNYVQIWTDYNRIAEVKQFLLQENNRFDLYRDDERFRELYYSYLCSVINFRVLHKEYELALEQLLELNQKYPQDKRNEDKVYSVLLQIHKEYDAGKTKDFKRTENYLAGFKRVLPEYEDVYGRISDYHYNEMIDEDFRNNRYEAGIEKFYTYIKVFREDKRILAKIKDAYLHIIIEYYEKKEYLAAIEYSEKALSRFNQDAVLLNNLKVIFQKSIEDDLHNTRNYTRSRNTLNKALLYFPDDAQFKDYDKQLQGLRY